MSHSKERSEKNCLNCGQIVQGRYCQNCGQENIEPKETLWGLVSHFFQDITHFDGKFFSTGKLLLTKPGFLPKEYLSGKRASYLHPIRMYVFTSALFFLIFYSVFNVKNLGLSKKKASTQVQADLAVAKARSLKNARNHEDSEAIEQTFRVIERLPIDVKIDKHDLSAEEILGKEKDKKPTVSVADTGNAKKQTADSGKTAATNKAPVYRYSPSGAGDSGYKSVVTTQPEPKDTGSDASSDDDDSTYSGSYSPKSGWVRNKNDFGIFDISRSITSAYNSREEYDSAQAKLPSEERDNWIGRRFAYQTIEFKKRYGDDQGELMQDLLDKFMHTFPYLLFISLPLYAMFLKLLYIRRKQFFYADHGLFLIYLYIFTFLHLLVFFALRALKERFDYWWLGLIMFIFVLYGIYYAYKSMRKFYAQGRGKTILKFLLLNILSFTTISVLFVLFFIIALLRL